MKGQQTGQNDLQVVEPDSLTLEQLVALDDGLGCAEWRAWIAREKARCPR